MANATNVQSASYWDGAVYHDWTDLGLAVNMPAGYGYNDRNWVTVVKFTLPTPAKSVTLSIYGTTYAPDKGSCSLKYKLTSAQDSSLTNATQATAGDGTWSAVGNYSQNTLTITKNLSAGTHYLYLWTNAPATTSNFILLYFALNGNYATTLTYVEGSSKLPIYVNAGGSVKQVDAVYMNVGGKIKECTVYLNADGKIKTLT